MNRIESHLFRDVLGFPWVWGGRRLLPVPACAAMLPAAYSPDFGNSSKMSKKCPCVGFGVHPGKYTKVVKQMSIAFRDFFKQYYVG